MEGARWWVGLGYLDDERDVVGGDEPDIQGLPKVNGWKHD